MKEEKKNLIFDFDGVILDSVQIKTLAFKKIFQDQEEQVISKIVKYHEYYGGVSRYKKIEYFYKHFIKKKLTKYENKKRLKQFRDASLDLLLKAKLIKGVLYFLKNNYTKYNFFISSGSPEAELKKICKKKKISKYFIRIFGSPKNKIFHIKKIIRLSGAKKKDYCFIGDSITDYSASKKMNIKFIQIGNFLKPKQAHLLKCKNFINFKKKIDNLL